MLVTPPYHSGVVEAAGVWLPLGLVYVAGEARKAGAEVRLYDAMSLGHTHAQIEKEMEAFKPDIVGTGAFTALEPDAREVCRSAKRVSSDIVTVVGGVHPTFLWREILEQEPAVDVVVRGEGEQPFSEIVSALANGARLDKVKGLAYRREGTVITTPECGFVADLDALSPAWDLVEWPAYFYRPTPEGRLAIVSSSRGCTSRCAFCSQQRFWKQSWRGRDALAFVTELELLRDRHDVRVVMLADETPTTDRARWERILDLCIERRVGVELLMETRVDHIVRDEALLPRYREAGVSHIYVGVEAVNQPTLDLFRKETEVRQSKRAIELINAHDMVSETSFVLGMPDETPESIAQAVELAKDYAPDLAFFLAIAPWPYAEMYEELRPYIEVTDYRRYNLVEPVVRPKAMTLEQLRGEMMRATRAFYMDKMKRYKTFSAHKRAFLVKVMKIMAEHSYLGDEMRAVGHALPADVKEMTGL